MRSRERRKMSDETEVVTGKCSPGHLAVREGERVARKAVKVRQIVFFLPSPF